MNITVTGTVEEIIALGERLKMGYSLLPMEKPPEVNDVIRAHLANGNKIDAIKMYREVHQVGLREAKEGVERLMMQMG